MPDPNLLMLEDAVGKLAPFLDEIVSLVALRSACLLQTRPPLRFAEPTMSM
jgi:hypothetical protein